MNRFVFVFVLASGCAATAPKIAEPKAHAVAAPYVAEPERPSILSGDARAMTPSSTSKVNLEPCEIERRSGPGVRQTDARCYPFNGVSAVSRDATGTLVALYSQSGSILLSDPTDGPPSVETLPVWAPLWMRRHDGVLDVVSEVGWKRKANGAWTDPAPRLDSGNLAFAAVWNGRNPVLLARTGGTGGTHVSAFEFVGKWVETPIWPTPDRPSTPPHGLQIEGMPGSLFFSYVPTWDGAGGLVVEPPRQHPVVAVPVVPRDVRGWRLAQRPGEPLPLVALMTDGDITVAMPDANGLYQTGTIPGARTQGPPRLPPPRDEPEPAVRDGVASCSETVDSVRATRLAAPAPIVTSRGDFLLFVRHRVEQRHRWTAIPTVDGPRCDWLAERATDEKELVLAKLTRPSRGAPMRAEEVLRVAVPIALGPEARPFLQAEVVGGAIDVVVGSGMQVEHIVLDVP